MKQAQHCWEPMEDGTKRVQRNRMQRPKQWHNVEKKSGEQRKK